VTFRKCFIGRQAVDFLINSGMSRSRKGAALLATTLMTRFELFEHVTQDGGFADSYRFYRFLEGNDFFVDTMHTLPRISVQKSRRHVSLDDSDNLSIGSSNQSLRTSLNMDIEEGSRESGSSSDVLDIVNHETAYATQVFSTDASKSLGLIQESSTREALGSGVEISSDVLNIAKHDTSFESHVFSTDISKGLETSLPQGEPWDMTSRNRGKGETLGSKDAEGEEGIFA